MANGSVTDESDVLAGGAPDSGTPPAAAGGAPPTPPGGPPGMAGGGGGGILAALARNREGPQISAPGPGNMADSMNMLSQAIALIQHAALGLQPGSPLHKDSLQAAQRLSRHLGGGMMGPAAGAQKTMLGDMLRRTVQNMLLQRIQSQAGMAQPGSRPDESPGGAMPPQAPMPATPLPGS